MHVPKPSPPHPNPEGAGLPVQPCDHTVLSTPSVPYTVAAECAVAVGEDHDKRAVTRHSVCGLASGCTFPGSSPAVRHGNQCSLMAIPIDTPAVCMF